MYSRYLFSLEYYYNRSNFFFFFNGLNRKFYKTNGFFTGITYYRPFNRFCISLNLNLKYEAFSFLSKYRSLLDPNKGFFFDLRKFNFYIYFLSLDDFFSRSITTRFKYSSKTYFFQFFYFFRTYFFSKIFISLFFFDRFNLFMSFSKLYINSTLNNFSNSSKLSLNRYYLNFVYLFSNLFKFFDLPFIKSFSFFYFFILNFFVKLNTAVITFLTIFVFMADYFSALLYLGRGLLSSTFVLNYILVFFSFILFYNFNVYKLLLKKIFYYVRLILINFLYVFDSFFFFNFDQLLFKNYFNFYNDKLNQLSFSINLASKDNYSFLSDVYSVKKKPVFRRYNLPYEIYKATQNTSLDLAKYKRHIFFRKKSFFSLSKHVKFRKFSFPIAGGLMNVSFNFYKKVNFIALTGSNVRRNFLTELLVKKNSLKFFFFKDFLFNFVNFISWTVAFFNKSFFLSYKTDYISDFNFDYLNFFFIAKFYKNLFFGSNYFFNFEDTRSRISSLKFKLHSYRNNLANFDNFASLVYSTKHNYRLFNIFNLDNSKIKNPLDYKKFNYEVRAFSLLNNKFKFSLFLKSNFKFFHKFLKVILFNRISFFLGEKFFIKLTKPAIKHLLSKFIFFKALYYRGHFLYINLLILDKLVLDYLTKYFFVLDNQFFKGYFISNFFFLKDKIFNNLYSSKSLLKFNSSFLLRFNISLSSNINNLTDDVYRNLFKKIFEMYKVYRSYGLFSIQAATSSFGPNTTNFSYKRVGRKKFFYLNRQPKERELHKFKHMRIKKSMRPRFRNWLLWKKVANKFFIRKRINRSRRFNISLYLFSRINYVDNLFPKSLKKFNLLNPFNSFNDGLYLKSSPEGNFFFHNYRLVDTLLNVPIKKPIIIKRPTVLSKYKKKTSDPNLLKMYNERLFWDFLNQDKRRFSNMLRHRFKRIQKGKVFFNYSALTRFIFSRYVWKLDNFRKTYTIYPYKATKKKFFLKLYSWKTARKLDISKTKSTTSLKTNFLANKQNKSRKLFSSFKQKFNFNRTFTDTKQPLFKLNRIKNNFSSVLTKPLSQKFKTSFATKAYLDRKAKVFKKTGLRVQSKYHKRILERKLRAMLVKRHKPFILPGLAPYSIWKETDWFINFSRKLTTFPEYYAYSEKLQKYSVDTVNYAVFPYFFNFFILNNQYDYNYFYSMTLHWKAYNHRVLNFFGQHDHHYVGSENFLMKNFLTRRHNGINKIAVQAKYYKLFEPRPDFGWSRYVSFFKLFSLNKKIKLKFDGSRYFYGKHSKIRKKNKETFNKFLDYYNHFYTSHKDFYFRLFMDFDSYCFFSFPSFSLFFFKSHLFNNYLDSASKTSFTLNSFLSLLTFINWSFTSSKNSTFYFRCRFLASRFFKQRVIVKRRINLIFFFFKRSRFRSVNFSWSLKFFFFNKHFMLGLKKYYFTKYRFFNKYMFDLLHFKNSNLFNNLNFSSNRFRLYRDNLYNTYYYLAKLKHREKRVRLGTNNFQSGTGSYPLNSMSNDLYLFSSISNNTLSSINMRYPLFFYRFSGMNKNASALSNTNYRFVKVNKKFRFDRYFAEGQLNELIDKSYINYLKLFGNVELTNFYFVADYFFIWLVIFYRKVSIFIFNRMYFFFVLTFLLYMKAFSNFQVLDDFNRSQFFEFGDIYFLSASTEGKFSVSANTAFNDTTREDISLLSPFLKVRINKIKYLPRAKSFFVFSFSNIYSYQAKLNA